MIHLIRQIRRGLLNQGKFQRYVLYAIGEILLVMIGILLALQVNNWNENNKRRSQEARLLVQLNNDLRSNLTEIKELHDFTIIRTQAKDSILYFLQYPDQFDKKIRAYLHAVQMAGIFNLASAAYKSIESGGISVLSNDSLRAKISHMYEYHFHNIHERRTLDYNIISQRLLPFYNHHLIPGQIAWDNSLLGDHHALNTPQNPEALLTNQQFINILTELHTMARARRYMQETTIEELEKLILTIDQEIERLQR